MPEDASSLSRDPLVVCTTGEDSCDALDQQLSKSWLRIAVAGVFAGQGMMFSLAMTMTPPPFGSTAYVVLHGGLIVSALVVMLFLGGPLFRSTYGMLLTRRLSIEGLFTLSLLGAFVGSLISSFTGQGGVFYEVVSIVIAIYTVGRMLSERSQARLSMESDRLLADYDHAVVVDAEGRSVRLPVAEVVQGAKVRVEPGAAFTVDGVVLSGVGYVRETALTGEPLPVVRHAGDFVRAGTWSVDGVFEVQTSAVFGERELDRILKSVEDSSGNPSDLQRQANDLIQFFLPLVACVSILTAVYWAWAGAWTAAVLNSMAVLLVACPCALGLATPVAIWQGLYQLARMGLVSRNGSLIDALAQTRHIFFDKTGTLSESTMQVTECLVDDAWSAEREAILGAVRQVEIQLEHPVARALVNFIPERAHNSLPEAICLIPGQGVETQVIIAGKSRTLQIGEATLADEASEADLSKQLLEARAKRVWVFIDGKAVAIFVVRERERGGVTAVWERLAAMQIRASVLTGDPEPRINLPASIELASGLSAAEKTQRVLTSKASGAFPVFVGDGINDAAAMANAVGSIAMGSGAGLTRSAASGQLVADQLEVLPHAIEMARSIRSRLRGNLLYAAGYNGVGMFLAAAGWLHPVAAAIIMLLSSFWVTARALIPPRYNRM